MTHSTICVFQRRRNERPRDPVQIGSLEVRKAFEPLAPPISERLRALDELRRSGVRTYAMIAPILPGAEALVEQLAGRVDRLIIDRMNYDYANEIYRRCGWEDLNTDEHFARVGRQIAEQCRARGIPCLSA